MSGSGLMTLCKMTSVNYHPLPHPQPELSEVGNLKMKSLRKELKSPAQGHTAGTGWSQDTAAYRVTPKPLATRYHTPHTQTSNTPNLHPVSNKSLREISLQLQEIRVEGHLCNRGASSDRRTSQIPQGRRELSTALLGAATLHGP